MGIIKAFGSRVSDEDVYARFSDFSRRMWGNADADAILFAYDRLLRQNTKRKVLIVLSDGSPADGVGETDASYALKVTVKQIEEDKQADIIGIGIMDTEVRRFYKQHTVINKAEELEDGLMKVITSNILTGVS
jgi:cobalamin biosynthesis protein CobT